MAALASSRLGYGGYGLGWAPVGYGPYGPLGHGPMVWLAMACYRMVGHGHVAGYGHG